MALSQLTKPDNLSSSDSLHSIEHINTSVVRAKCKACRPSKRTIDICWYGLPARMSKRRLSCLSCSGRRLSGDEEKSRSHRSGIRHSLLRSFLRCTSQMMNRYRTLPVIPNTQVTRALESGFENEVASTSKSPTRSPVETQCRRQTAGSGGTLNQSFFRLLPH